MRWRRWRASTAGPATARRCTRSWSGARSWRGPTPRPNASCRLQIGALAEEPAGTPRGGDRRLRARAGDLGQRPRGGAGARSAVHEGRALGRSDAAARGPAEAGRPAASAIWSASSSGWRRSSTIGRTIARAALEHLRVVLTGDPDHPGAITMLEGMLDDIAVQGQAAELLEPVYAGRADWPVADQDRRDSPAAGRGARRSGWRGRSGSRASTRSSSRTTTAPCAGTARCSRKRRRSASAWSSSFAWPTSWIAGRTWRACWRATWRASWARSRRCSTSCAAPRRSSTTGWDSGPRRRSYYRRLFDARPDDREVAQLFEAALERWGAWQELRELIDEEAGRAVDPAAKLALLRRSAKLDEERLDSRGRAIGTLREAMDVDPADRGTAAELERLLGAEGQWHELADHICRHAGSHQRPAREADAVRLRLARIQYERLDDVVAAIDRYAEVLERTPGQPQGGRGAGVAGGERRRALPHRRDPGAGLPAVGRPRQAGRRAGRAAGDGRRPRRAGPHPARDGGDPSAPRPAGPGVRLPQPRLAGRRRVGRDAGRDGGAGSRGRPARRAGRGAGEGGRRGRRSRICRRSCGRCPRGCSRIRWAAPPDAIEAWRSALSARPDDRDAFLALERLLSGAARSAELVDVLEKHLEITTDAGERKAIAKRIAVLYEDALKQREQAVRAWETVLEIDANDGDALESLAQLHLAAARSASWPRSTRASWSWPIGREERRLLFAQSARIFETQLAEPEQAVEQLRKLLEETPGDAEALARWTASSPARGGTPISSRCSTSGPGSRRPRGSATSWRSARRASPRPSCPTSRGRSAAIRASWRRRPTIPARARRCRRSRAATTTACRPSRCWSRSCATRGPGRRSSSCWSCGWRSRTRSIGGSRCWARSRASRRWSDATSKPPSRPGRAR